MSQAPSGRDAARHTLTHRRAPAQWHDGFPLGNGAFGVMVWGDGDPLCFTLDHADLWDLRNNRAFAKHPEYTYAGIRRAVAEGRFKELEKAVECFDYPGGPHTPTKVYIGRAELNLGPAQEYCCSLDLDTATVSGSIRTVNGEYALTAFVDRCTDVFCLRVADADARLRLVPMVETGEELKELGHPAPVVIDDGELCTLTQQIPEGSCYAVAHNTTGPDFFIAVAIADTASEAAERARRLWDEAAASGIDAFEERHIAAWREFWSASTVHLPEQRFEYLWHFGLYLLACSSRRGHLPPGLQGVWAMDGIIPPWHGDYHNDMNIQEQFWPAGTTGHIDLLDTWCDFMLECIPAAREFTREFFGTEGTFWPCANFPGYHTNTLLRWGAVKFAWSHTGWLAWLVWLRWRYTMDVDWLREIGYPVLVDLWRFYEANLEPGDDGYLHIPLSNSPEYRSDAAGAWCADPNVDIALIRRTCDWLIEFEQALGIEEFTDRAQAVHDALVPYHLTDEGVLCLWADHPLDESHRHPSQLMAIHPAMDITIDDGERARQIIAASVGQFCSLGQYQWAGHTYAQLVSMAAVTGRAGWAYDSLLQYAERWIRPNGMHFNRDFKQTGATLFSTDLGGLAPFTMESCCGITQGVCDMLVQGFNDIVRVFPAVPEHWRDVAFENLVTEGAFKVSAIRLGGETVSVSITAGVDRQLRLRDPFDGAEVDIVGCETRREGDVLVADMTHGQEIVLRRAGTSVTMADAVTLVEASDTSLLGLK